MNYQLIISLLALSSCVLGQNATATATTTTARALQTPNFTPFTMQSLSNVTRNSYCSQQRSFCKTVCANNVNANTCNVHDATMGFSCLCANGQPPANINQTAYPAAYYYCMGNLKSCETACAGQSQCIVDCREALKCGYQEWDCSAGPCVKITPGGGSGGGSGGDGSGNGGSPTTTATATAAPSSLFDSGVYVPNPSFMVSIIAGCIFSAML